MKRIYLLPLTFLFAWAVLAAGIYTLTQGNTLGSDFLAFYRAGQTALVEHADPYTDQQALLNQLAIFKRPAAPGEDQLGFAYPPYALLPVLPLLGLDFGWAQAIWAAFLILSCVTLVLLAFPDAAPWINITFLFFYPVTFGLILGNFCVLMAGILLLTYSLASRDVNAGRSVQVVMGIALAWVTAKPQFVWLYLIFFLLWATRKQWWPMLISFGASLVIFLAFSFATIPNWPAMWLDRLSKYTEYNQTWLILAVFFKEILPASAVIPVTVIIGIAIIALTGWLFYRWWQGRLDSLLLLAWCGFAIFVLHPRGKSYEQIAFLMPMLAWACREIKLRSQAVPIFWLGGLVLSWVIFFLSKLAGAPASTSDWPVFFYIIWLGWLFSKTGLTLRTSEA